jgi:hypothetical protein
MATQVSVSRSTSSLGAHAKSPVRRIFTSHLRSADDRPTVTPTVAASEAWGTIRIVVNDDDTFEYLATIYNPRGEAFIGAYLRRGGTTEGGTVLATLFSDVTLRSPYIQLRGTVSVSRDARAGVLAEELREHPRDFSVSVHTSTSTRLGAIRGVVE